MVREEDLVIHLGDVMVARADQWDKYVAHLPGHKILVKGNHDRKSHTWYMDRGCAFSCDSFTMNMYGHKLLFTHEPALDGDFDLNIHGHCHADGHRGPVEDGKHYLVALEDTNYELIQLKRIVATWKRN